MFVTRFTGQVVWMRHRRYGGSSISSVLRSLRVTTYSTVRDAVGGLGTPGSEINHGGEARRPLGLALGVLCRRCLVARVPHLLGGPLPNTAPSGGVCGGGYCGRCTCRLYPASTHSPGPFGRRHSLLRIGLLIVAELASDVTVSTSNGRARQIIEAFRVVVHGSMYYSIWLRIITSFLSEGNPRHVHGIS